MRTLVWGWIRRVVALCLLFALTACTVTPATPASQLLLSFSDPKTFNSVISNEATSQELWAFLFEGLITRNGITSQLEPNLAETWQILDGGKRIVFTLRDNLKWSDGEALTADDVLFTFRDVLFNDRIPAGNKDVLRIGDAGALPKVRQLDRLRIEFELPEPFSPFLDTVGVPILPKHILGPTVSQIGSDGTPRFLSTWGIDTDVRQIIGCGPYRMVEYRPAERITLERNPHYRKAGQPYIQRVVLNIVDSTDTSLIQFRSRDLDVLTLRPEDFQLLKREEKRDNFTIYDAGPSLGDRFIQFNLNRGRDPKSGKPYVNPVRSKWFNDLAFRQAIAYGLDRPTMIDNVFRGLGQAQNSPIPVQSPFYLSPQEGLKTYDYNLDKAKSILKDAGYKLNSQGLLLDPEGNPVRFTMNTNAGNKNREALGTQVKSDLARLGIQVDFFPIDFNLLISKSDARTWECILLGLTGGLEPNSGANIWRSDGTLHDFNQGARPGDPPIPGYVVSDWEKRIDQLFITGAREFDTAKRRAIYGEFQQIVQEQLPMIYLVTPQSLNAVRDRVEGVQPSVTGSVLWNLEALRLHQT
ncbi:ABC transporter substrate-binding protein [Leptolyngbya sp. FACHB-261]|uniref:ABC transporter substrate-binding protein n=1 Tax=Leptolyngbya sp. FACHB-261 TaxID=2692806 RepID=UPI0016886A67|nr:ABC transporter substrate-binding protein [Leptolyngbya sp. FACHB-261]MBD2102938.1 ABC transporter substrate-binding protein [Leptolyngbya sp. FACHB-261]